MTILLKLLLWFAYIAADIAINYYIIEKRKERPNYLLLNIIRGGAFIVYGAFIWNTQANWYTFYLFVFCVTSFWLMFDLVLNTIRGKHPLYIGPESGWIDRFGVKYNAIYYAGKILAVVALLWSIAKIF